MHYNSSTFVRALMDTALISCMCLQAATLLIAVLAALLWANAIVEEGLTIVPGLGVVLFSRRYWIGRSSTFVPIEQISGVIINEVNYSVITHS